MIEEPAIVCSSTLIILGDELDPERVTQVLGLEPHKSWRRGERKRILREDGSTHNFDSFYEWGGWKCFISDVNRSLELEDQLAWWCDLLEPRKNAMRDLEEQGCYLSMDCFFATSEITTLVIDAELLQRLSSLRVDLSIRFSPDVPALNDEAEQTASAGARMRAQPEV